jgi:acyl-CoA synthetase (AMP-forming)/AMP-acid ligase II
LNVISDRDFTSDNISKYLREIAEVKGDLAGVIEARTGKRITFAELEKLSDQYAYNLVDYGVKTGDRVMVMVKPSADFICITFALFKIGAPVILIDPGMGYRNLLRCVSRVKPKIFIGIPKAHLFVTFFRKYFDTLTCKLCSGSSFGLFGPNILKLKEVKDVKFPLHAPLKDDLAAIIFTTGSTGPPKGVRYEHTIFAAQLRHIKEYYQITPNDTDQPAFPLFALFSTALGACAIIPDMDATKPSQVNPRKFIDSLIRNNVTYSFGSPALWNVVSKYCLANSVQLHNLKKVLMAGAPVSGELLERMRKILPGDAEIHTPYGATESLPIVSIESNEIITDTWEQTKKGKGTCVGRPLPGIEIRIIKITEDDLEEISSEHFLGKKEIGEIIVSGDVVTKAYDNDERATRKAKTIYQNRLWHRMGDAGYLDTQGRLWFCGRTAHRVCTSSGIKYSVQCEAIVNNHPDIFRSALVGISAKNGFKTPVLVLEKEKNCPRTEEAILLEVRNLASQSELTRDISMFLFHKSFPVDIRHNAKIFREKLAVWAESKMVTE